MARKATGTVRVLLNDDGKPQWHGRFSCADGTRTPWVELDSKIAIDDVASAKASAARMAVRVRKAAAGQPVPTVGETVEEYAGRWHDWRESRGLTCVKDDRSRMKNHVLGTLGPLDVATVSRRQLEELVQRLDERIVKGEIGWKVATLAWSNVRRMFKDACSAKRLELRVREDNPAEHVQAPERGEKKEKQYLWPSEFLALVQCEQVPRRWRVLFALAVYVYARAGEVEALSWEDISFETGTIHIHKSVDRVRERGRIKKTKTGVSRRIPIEANLLPLLKAMHHDAEGRGRVIAKMPSPGMLSRKLKFYLEHKAKVERAELFATDATRKAITFHDLRATGITWMAARGDDPLRIKQRAGHASFQTTEGYIREAENLGASFGTVFPPLSEAIAPQSPRGRFAIAKYAKRQGVVVGATGFEPATESAAPSENSAAKLTSVENESPALAMARDQSERLTTDRGADLEAQIAVLDRAIALATRRLPNAKDDAEAEERFADWRRLCKQVDAKRAELQALRRERAGNLVDLAARRQ